MPLPFDVSRVLNYFTRRILAYDITCEKKDFEVKKTNGADYYFPGVIQPPTDKEIQLFDEGELASGAIIVYVKSNVNLYVADVLSSSTVPWKQTIIKHGGDEFRIKGVSNRDFDGCHKKYTAVRFIKERSNGNG